MVADCVAHMTVLSEKMLKPTRVQPPDRWRSPRISDSEGAALIAESKLGKAV